MLQTIQVVIEGISPLLVNRFHEDEADKSTSGVHRREERLKPEEDAEKRLYPVNGKGVPTFPSDNIRQSMIKAAARTKIGRRSAATDAAAAIYLYPPLLDLESEWHLDSRAVVIPATGGRILRHRPMFDEWQLEFSLQVNTDLIDAATVQKILEDAGALVGIGDYRPARKGPYGRFAIRTWEVEKR